MPPSPEGKVRARRALGHRAVAVVDHLALVVPVGACAAITGPAVRVPAFRVREVLLAAGGEAGRREEDVGWGQGVGGLRDGEGGFYFAHDGVDREVEAEGFFDDVLVQRQAREVAVLQGCEGRAQVCDLFVVELVGEFGLRGEVEDYPGADR